MDYDSWLESGIQDRYEEEERCSEYVAEEMVEQMKKGGRFHPFERFNWAEAISELRLDDELQDINIETADPAIRLQVEKYWEEIAERIIADDFYS
jgi:hypothetical protein